MQFRSLHLESSGSRAVLSAVRRESSFFIMSDTQTIKSLLRDQLRQQRRKLSPKEQRDAAEALQKVVQALPTWPEAQRVALYLAADGEIDPAPLAALARGENKLLFLPVVTDHKGLEFAQWDEGDLLSANRYNIPEPSVEAPRCPAQDLDIIFLPLVGWDKFGRRLGMGGGFYDRALSGNTGPLLVGLSHEDQQVEKVPTDSWDVLLDYVATDTALYRRQGD
jgi:5-formyltetrahydrofolate cyclo-ligase